MSSRPLSEPRRPCLIVSPSSAHACRLADDAMIEQLAPGQRPVEELDRAVDRRAFLVAGDEEADRAGKRRLGDEAQGGGDGSGDAPLHVAGAAAKKLAVGDLGRERIEPPPGDVAGRDDVGMAGESEIRPAGPEPRVQVQDRRRPGRLEGDELGCESSPGQEIAQIGQRPAVLGRHRATADQRARDLERSGRRGHRPTARSCRAPPPPRFAWSPSPASRGRRGRPPALPSPMKWGSKGWSKRAFARRYLGRISRTGAAQSRPAS